MCNVYRSMQQFMEKKGILLEIMETAVEIAEGSAKAEPPLFVMKSFQNCIAYL